MSIAQSILDIIDDTLHAEEKRKLREIVVDIGAADGNFGLSIIEKVSKLYLFEPQKSWHKALQATFKPWEDKVEIVSKMVPIVDVLLNAIGRSGILDTLKRNQKISTETNVE